MFLHVYSMEKTSPLISIIIPNYNRARLIGETLDSILAQTYSNWECIIVDDGSTDNSKEEIQKYVEKDARFQLHKRPANRPKGANACRNYGFELSKGKYIKWFDSDDILLPDCLEKQVEFLENNPEYDFVAVNAKEFIEKNNRKKIIQEIYPKISHPDNIFYDFALGHLHFITPSPLWKRSFLEGKRLFDENLHRRQESEFNFRILLSKPKFKYLDYYGVLIRRGHEHLGSISRRSVKPQLSVISYFDKMFQQLSKMDFSKKKETLQYIFYRQAANYYDLLSIGRNLKERIELSKKSNIDLIQYTNQIQLGFIDKLKLSLGLLTTKFFGKGYRLLYFKKFNYRDK